MLFLGTLEHQPDPLTDFAGFAEFITTSRFLWSHLINSILGAAIGSDRVIRIDALPAGHQGWGKPSQPWCAW
jgi:hypothetical protein